MSVKPKPHLCVSIHLHQRDQGHQNSLFMHVVAEVEDDEVGHCEVVVEISPIQTFEHPQNQGLTSVVRHSNRTYNQEDHGADETHPLGSLLVDFLVDIVNAMNGVSFDDPADYVENVLVVEDHGGPHVGSPVAVDEASLKWKQTRCYLLQLVEAAGVEEGPEADGEDQGCLQGKEGEVEDALAGGAIEDRLLEVEEAEAGREVQVDVFEVK